MGSDTPKSRPIRHDPSARSASEDLPGFLARPDGAPVYHGFTVLESSMTDGWRLGIISDPVNPDGCDDLDGFVIAPDGSRAGLVWSTSVTEVSEVCEASPSRWGVYSVPLSKPVHSDDELIAEFRTLLPTLIELKARADGA